MYDWRHWSRAISHGAWSELKLWLPLVGWSVLCGTIGYAIGRLW